MNIFKNGYVIWIMGLSGAGKTTLANELHRILKENGQLSIVLDGDMLRAGVNKDLGFDYASRSENIRRTAEMAKLLIDNNFIVICSLITPLESDRNMVRTILNEKLIEVFLDCPIEVCEHRDVKGLYKKARGGEIKNFTGIDTAFEIPQKAHIIVSTSKETVADSCNKLYDQVCDIMNNKNL